MSKYIVAFYDGNQFLADWQGDPGRTCIKENAKKFKSEHAAKCALAYVKRVYAFRDYSDSYIEKCHE